MSNLEAALAAAVEDGRLLPESAANARAVLAAASQPTDRASIEELVADGEWKELDDRFFKKLSFGTSGLRGRTIGKIVTTAEAGHPTAIGRPEFPCTGTNAMNYGNLSRATQGLVRYLKRWAAEHGVAGRPKVVFSHDTRHFSREFAEYCARIVTELGCDAVLFDSHRPTPELSFAIRHLDAHAGVMHTASHNPPHDNGYKVYWNEGDPIVEPVVSGITAEVDAVESEAWDPVPESERGELVMAGDEVDREYLRRLEDLLLQPSLLEKAKGLKLVYTAIHGTGGVHVPAVLERLGFDFLTVPQQDVPDGRFPTVESPNPENAEALAMAIELAENEHADIVMGTDPDCDRLGVAVRDRSGTMTLLTGNQIGSLMAWYRTETFFEFGIIDESNRDHSVIIKTLVTTPLQNVIAERYGVPVVETLTGFKYIGAKQTKYEKSLPEEIRRRYRKLSTAEACEAQLAHGKFFIFGGEESYGYLGADFIRDKDGNGAVVMFAELAAYARSRGLTLVELMDEVYAEFGYFLERPKSMTFEGAAGAQTMKTLVASFSEDPPEEIGGARVAEVRDYGRNDYFDSEGDLIPKENMLMIDLEDGRRFAVRPSGTEPKVKFYLFGRKCPAPGERFSPEELAAAKEEVAASLDALVGWIDREVAARTAGADA